MRIDHKVENLVNPLECKIQSVSEDMLTVQLKDETLSLDMSDVIQGKVKLRW